jgi:hypothetical protein
MTGLTPRDHGIVANGSPRRNAGWDRPLLDLELQYLTELDLDFDVTVTGFELPEINLLIGELLNANENDPADAIVEVQSRPPITARATSGKSAAIV